MKTNGIQGGARWAIQTNTFCDGWVNTWLDDDEQSMTFNSKEAAQAALDEYLHDQHAAVEAGDMADKYDADDFQLMEICK